MGINRTDFIKVLASRIGVMEIEILEETNKRDVDEALKFIESHPHEGASWMLMPMKYESIT